MGVARGHFQIVVAQKAADGERGVPIWISQEAKVSLRAWNQF